MSEALPSLPETCRIAMEAIQSDPLELPEEALRHLRQCPECREARVHCLAHEESPQALVPAEYYQHLPRRILRKLPVRRASRRQLPLLWLAAGILLAAASLSGFLAGRANRTPVVEASLPATAPLSTQDVVPISPFHAEDEVLSELSTLSQEESEALASRLEPEAQKP